MINSEFYTVVFRGNVQEMSGNLFNTISPFGEVVAISMGDLTEEVDRLENELESAKNPPSDSK